MSSWKSSGPSSRKSPMSPHSRKMRGTSAVLADLKSRNGGGFSTTFSVLGSSSLVAGDSTLRRRSTTEAVAARTTSTDEITSSSGTDGSPRGTNTSGYLVAPNITADMGERKSNVPVSMSPVTETTTEVQYLRQKKNFEFIVEFNLPRRKKVLLRASNLLCVTDIKERLTEDARALLSQSRRMTEEKVNQILKSPEEYVLKVVGIEEYITNESLPLKRVDFIQVCSKSYLTPKFEMIPKAQMTVQGEDARKNRIIEELKIGTQISSLIGSKQIQTFMEYEDEEISDFRRETIKHRIEEYRRIQSQIDALSSGDTIQGLPEYCLGEPLPMSIPPSINFVCNFPDEHKTTSKLSCSSVAMASQVRDLCFKRFCRAIGPEASQDKKADDYILKVTGYQDYIHGATSQLISYDHVRKCISKSTQLELSLVDRAPIEEYLQELESRHDSIVDKIIAYEEPQDENRDEIFDMLEPLRVKLCSVERALSNPGSDEFLFIHAEIFHGGHKISEQCTQPIVALTNPRWNTTITFNDVMICNIPRGTRISFTMYKRSQQSGDPTALWQQGVTKNDVAISWVACQLINHKRYLQHGLKNLRMWVGAAADPVGTCGQNLLELNTPILFVEFLGQPHCNPVYYPETVPTDSSRSASPLSATDEEELQALIRSDPLTDLSESDKKLLWDNRIYCTNIPAALPKVLLATKWDDCDDVQEIHRLLHVWSRPSPIQALELLDAKFADPAVRDFGVSCISYLSDGECYDFMLQLTQVVKHEPHHISALALFLLKRAWGNNKIAHSFYWFLKAEMHLPDVAERYTILLEAFLRGSGNHRQELLKQQEVIEKLVNVAVKIKGVPSATRKEVLLKSLAKLKFPSRFQLPLDQRMEAKGLIVEKCKYMDSKKLPLWLVWENAEDIGKPILIIFKAGDDLRQDLLTLQMIKIMDKLWKNEGMDLLLNPYGCIATGDEIGMIEVVLNADTTANINKAAGGTKAVLYKDTLTKWLRANNPSDAEFRKAQENFCISCAGYCVATFVLGIGDRHNDNIMVTKEGHLFHIDFGHFLGNFKKKFGFKRERAPFVFTPQYAHVLGGTKHEIFQLFTETACRAYNVLRKHSDMFINLFQMMLCTGIPELRSADDCEYLRMAFGIGLTDEEAAKRFTSLIMSSLKTKTTVLNDIIHVWVHS